MHNDVIQMREQQGRKDYHDTDSALPDKSKITAHAAEVLRQVEGAGLAAGGWVGGDSWFGSILTAVEVKRRFNVHSTWIIKQNSQLYPKKVLHAILKARHGENPAGHWIVMLATIGGVSLFAFAYAWSKAGVSYFLSTCGSTSTASKMYETHCENEYSMATFRLERFQDVKLRIFSTISHH